MRTFALSFVVLCGLLAATLWAAGQARDPEHMVGKMLCTIFGQKYHTRSAGKSFHVGGVCQSSGTYIALDYFI